MWWLLPILAGCSSSLGPEDVVSGDYQFYTLDIEDTCLDGALEVLFMPEGRDEPHPFEYLIYVPAEDETPLSYEVDFREPFVGMPVTVETSDTGLSVRGSVMDAVQLDAVKYGDCVATMAVDVDLWPTDKRTLGGSAVLDVSNPRGEEGRCPLFEADPCQVTLTLEAQREGDGSPSSEE